MGIAPRDISSIIGPFIAEAGARGWTPPLLIAGHDCRGWLLCQQGDALAVDAFGDPWWVRMVDGRAHIVRRPWPEELARLWLAIERSIAELRARASHPAGGSLTARRRGA